MKLHASQRTLGPRVKIFESSEDTLLSPAADVLMAGGMSLIVFILLQLFVPENSDITLWASAVYYASFLVNYPHFAVSYQLLYADSRKDFFAFSSHPGFSLKLWWAGLVVPLLMTMYLSYAMWVGSSMLMGYAVNAMYFLVGWHYVKQIFGCAIVLSSLKKIRYKTLERWCMLVPLYSLWFLYFTASNTQMNMSEYLSIPYTNVVLPEGIINGILWVTILSTFVMVGMFLSKYIREKVSPPLSAVAAIVSIYVWMMPLNFHPYFLLIIPFFHSLQYLLFVLAYKRNSIMHKVLGDNTAKNRNSEWWTSRRTLSLVATTIFLVLPLAFFLFSMTQALPEGGVETILNKSYGMLMTVSSTLWMRTVAILSLLMISLFGLRAVKKESVLWHFLQFSLHILILGGLLFSLAPAALDILARNDVLPTGLRYNAQIFGPTLYLFMFTIFINIHHFFVDNVLWRRENPNMREHLFG